MLRKRRADVQQRKLGFPFRWKTKGGEEMKRIALIAICVAVVTVLGAYSDSGSSQVELISMSGYIGPLGYPQVVGELENTGEVNVRFVGVVVTWYSPDDTIVGTDSTYAILDIIKPGELSPFKSTMLIKNPDVERFKVQWEWDRTTEQPRRDVIVIDNNAYVNSLGMLEVVGEVENTGSNTAIFVQIIGTFYDSEGEVIEVDTTYAELDTLRPGRTSPFKMTLLNKAVASRIDTYGLVVQCM